ncbi:MAG: DUF1566 domain-containing protein [Bacteroidales bacterium]|nr:DUF1566 domain-containing protein [Bacteroidales bacterium]
MKKLFTLFVIIALTISVFAQSPQKMSYQCVVRNASGVLMVNQTVGMKNSILQGSATGTVVFSETYSPNPQTNANGLVSIEIGSGTPITGTFSSINWANGLYFLKTETDPTGGTNYTIIGTSQLLSVPYALYSKTAKTADYNDLTNKPVLFDGTWISLTGKPLFATVATSGSYSDLINKPTLFDGTWINITGKPTTLGGYGITDAMSISHVANGITSNMIANWNTAYGWGNHSGLYRPIGYVPTWNEITGKPTFTAVATSGSYNDLTNKPALFSGNYNDLTNKPILFDGTWTNITGKPTTLSGYGITDGMSTSHVVNGITSNMITNWNTVYGWGNHSGLYKPDSYIPTWIEITGKPTFAAVATSGSYADLLNKPVLFDGTWGSLSGKPTFATVATSGAFADLLSKPTTLAGFGITDAMNTSHTANGITSSLISNWNTAFTWGNHALAGYVPNTRTISINGTAFDLTVNRSWNVGTVTSVGLSLPNVFILSGSPITTTGTLTATLTSQTANMIFASPDGSPGTPAFRSLVTSDLPGLDWSKITSGKPTTLAGYGITDFDFTGATTNDLLKFNGSKWVRFTPDYALTSHTHANATTSISGFMSGADKTKLNGLQNADGTETKISTGTNITITGTGSAASPYVINASTGSSSSHSIGESYGGGIVFYVYDGGQHGLIATTTDQSTGIQWYNGTYRYTGTMSEGLGAGEMNTALIVSAQMSDNQTGNFAAKVCAVYSVTVDGITYGDWYLPSKYELTLLYAQKSVVGGFGGSNYWSSTEINNLNAYGWDLTTGATVLAGKTSTLYVRAIRAF